MNKDDYIKKLECLIEKLAKNATESTAELKLTAEICFSSNEVELLNGVIPHLDNEAVKKKNIDVSDFFKKLNTYNLLDKSIGFNFAPNLTLEELDSISNFFEVMISLLKSNEHKMSFCIMRERTEKIYDTLLLKSYIELAEIVQKEYLQLKEDM